MLRALLAAAAVALLIATTAGAHDTDAPPGAPHTWLPKKMWVMNHWVPFDETRLHTALHTTNRGVERWLRDDHRTIAQLAERRTGMDTGDLADHLVAPWRSKVSAGHFRVLRRRTIAMLTQGHLAQHVLYHYFHGTVHRSRLIFGVGPKVYQRLRARGLTPLQVGRRGGRSARHVKRGMRRFLRDIAEHGVHMQAQSPVQARYMLRRRLALLGCFLHRPLPKLDPGNPYGDPNNGHGPHARGERNGLQPGSKEDAARRDPHSCWHEPRLR
jgi:hypothetical protein